MIALAALATVVGAPPAVGAPLGPLRVATVHDGIGFGGLINGLAVDRSGRAWSVASGLRARVGNTDGVSPFALAEPDSDEIGYIDVFEMPGGGVLELLRSHAAIVDGSTRTALSEPLPPQLGEIVTGPLGAWFWSYDDQGSGLTLIKSDGVVAHLPKSFTSTIHGSVIASDAESVWVVLVRVDGGLNLVRVDRAGLHDVARLNPAVVTGQVDSSGRLVILQHEHRRSSLLRIDANGAVRHLATLPRGFQGSALGIDSAGTTWVADYLAPRVARVSPSGAVRSIAVGAPGDPGLERIVVHGGNIWFRSRLTIGRLVTTPGRCVVPDVRALRVTAARRLVRDAGCRPRGAMRGPHVVRQAPPAGTVVPARARVLLANGPRRQLRTPAACSIRRPASVIARGPHAFVTFTPTDTARKEGPVWTACHPADARRTVLDHGEFDRLGGFEVLSHFAFAGRTVAYAISYIHRSSVQYVRLADTGTGKSVLSTVVASPDGYEPNYPKLLQLLTDGRSLVYLIRDPEYHATPAGTISPSYEELAIVTAGGERTLDEAPTGSLADVRIDGPVVRWSRDGQARVSSLR